MIWSLGQGISGDFSKDSSGVNFPIPKLDIGQGLGMMMAKGTSTTYTYASPVINFPRLTGTIYTPVIYINSPPNIWSPQQFRA
jgi:hypothetical protein